MNYYCKFSASDIKFIYLERNEKLQNKKRKDKIQAMSLKIAFTLEDIIGDERKLCSLLSYSRRWKEVILIVKCMINLNNHYVLKL